MRSFEDVTSKLVVDFLNSIESDDLAEVACALNSVALSAIECAADVVNPATARAIGDAAQMFSARFQDQNERVH